MDRKDPGHQLRCFHRAVGSQGLDLVIGQADFRQHLARLRADLLGWKRTSAASPSYSTGWFNSHPALSVSSAARHCHQGLHVRDLRISDDLLLALHRRVPNLQRLHHGTPFFRGAPRRRAGDPAAHLRPFVQLSSAQKPASRGSSKAFAYLSAVTATAPCGRPWLGSPVGAGKYQPTRLRLPIMFWLFRRVHPAHQGFRLQVERRLHQAGIDAAALAGPARARSPRGCPWPAAPRHGGR